MIKIANISVMNMDNAIRGMRNPLNSWAKSDSYTDENGVFIMGENDFALAMKLVNAGSDHRKFLRQILVSMDICAPMYWWKEYDTYKVGTVANSTSTMHKIQSKQFTREDFSCDRMSEDALSVLDGIIDYLERERIKYVDTKDKAHWHNMIQILPSSYNQLRTLTLDYEVLRNMHHARKAHKLDEWREFCERIATLPYSELII